MNRHTPATDSPGAAWASPLLCGFLGFVLVALNLFIDDAIYDESLLPRLLPLMVFLAAAVPLVLLPALARRLDTSILREPVVLASAAYLAATCLSLTAALNVSAGWTDVFRTLGGFLVLCLACLLLPATPRWREHLLQVATIAALIGAGVGFAELATRLGIGLHGRRQMEAVTGLMSNVNLYAGILLLMLPWCACGAVLLRGAWRAAATTAAIAVVALILLLQSRATWLGLATAAVVAGGIVLRRGSALGLPIAARRLFVGLLSGGVAAAVGAAALTGSDTAIGRQLERLFVVRPHQAAGPSDGGRTMIWGITARMIADHPLVGVGVGNFTVRLHEYYGGDDLDFTNLSSDNWVQPHNDYLWVWAEKGLPGIAAFLAILAGAFWSLRTVLRSGPSREDAWIAIAAIAALTGYAVLSGLDFPLDRVSHQMHLAVLLAVATVLKHAARPISIRPVPLPAWLVLPPLLSGLALGTAYAAAAIAQETFVMAARRACRDGDWLAMRDAARRATTPWKTLDPLVTPVAYLEGKAELQLGHVPEAIACLERAWDANPNRMYVVNDLGIAYAAGDRFAEAIECFRIVANRYPHRIEPRNNLAGAFMETGRFAEAVAVLEDVPEALRNEAMRENLRAAREQLVAESAAP
jgi:O-antigen ligase